MVEPKKHGTLIRTKLGDVDLSWVLTLLFGTTACAGFLAEIFLGKKGSMFGWGTIIACFSLVIMAAVPIAKARLLSESKLPRSLMDGLHPMGGSTAEFDHNVPEDYA